MCRAAEWGLALSAALLLSACAAPQRIDERIERTVIAEPRMSSPPVAASPSAGAARSGPVRLPAAERSTPAAATDAQLHAELIQSMLERGQFYAAVAHIEAQRVQVGDSADLRWLEADARRRLRQYDLAEPLYRSLLKGAYAARAEHGLGLLAAARGQAPAAQRHLEAAVRLSPTTADFRNDLGYAYLKAGAYEAALTQLATATELSPDDLRARSNLILLLLVNGDRRAAEELATLGGVSPERFARLQAEAHTLRARSRNP